MCSEMLTAIHRTGAMAVFATPSYGMCSPTGSTSMREKWLRRWRMAIRTLLLSSPLSVSARTACAISSLGVAAAGKIDLVARFRH